MNSIRQTFAQANQQGRGTLVIYITAGDPSLDQTVRLVDTLSQAGADIVELGIPYSDPLADGPTIQAASQRALAAGCTVRGVLDCVAEIKQHTEVPLVIMTCFNPILQFGMESFAQACQEVGVDGVLVSDLPPVESDEWVNIAAAHSLATIFLVAPTTPPERIRQATDRTTGFVYAISRPGVTGARDRLPADLHQSVQRIREVTDLPIAVGFGISTPQQVAAVVEVADGAVVGSAVVDLIARIADTNNLYSQVERFVAELSGR